MPFPSRVGIAVAVTGNPGIFREIVSCGPNGHIRINEHEAVKIIVLPWNPASVPNHELRGFIQKFINVIRRQVFNRRGNKGNTLYPTLYSLRVQAARAGATLDYWQNSLEE